MLTGNYLAVIFYRIERLWRDVFGGVLDLFYTYFYNLEHEGLLYPDDEVQLYALHWSFLPHIQRHLQFFKDGWNHHRLRTEGNQSPHQLWTRHQLEADPLQVCMCYACLILADRNDLYYSIALALN